jgi:hypothetical protein
MDAFYTLLAFTSHKLSVHTEPCKRELSRSLRFTEPLTR